MKSIAVEDKSLELPLHRLLFKTTKRNCCSLRSRTNKFDCINNNFNER